MPAVTAARCGRVVHKSNNVNSHLMNQTSDVNQAFGKMKIFRVRLMDRRFITHTALRL